MVSLAEQCSITPETHESYELNYTRQLYASLMSLQYHCSEKGFDQSFVQMWEEKSVELYNYWMHIYQHLREGDCGELPNENIKLLSAWGENSDSNQVIIKREYPQEITEITIYPNLQQEGTMHIASILFTDPNRTINDSVDIRLQNKKIARWNITEARLPKGIRNKYPIPILSSYSMDLSKHI